MKFAFSTALPSMGVREGGRKYLLPPPGKSKLVICSQQFSLMQQKMLPFTVLCSCFYHQLAPLLLTLPLMLASG